MEQDTSEKEAFDKRQFWQGNILNNEDAEQETFGTRPL